MNQMENKLSADEWMKTILDNKKKLKWTTTPLDKELLKPYHSKTSAIKVIDGSLNPNASQLFERIRQRDDNVILLLQLLPINSNKFFKINYKHTLFIIFLKSLELDVLPGPPGNKVSPVKIEPFV